ncbi:MAG: hypothetical protein FJW31_28815 [Acidobacteria bacterium]|nr:hypothetical protein [Acidobacteriota bacterium]
MSALFVVERNGVKPEFRIERLERGTKSSEVATFDLTILVRSKTVAQIYGAKLVEGRDGLFVTGPSFIGSDGTWFTTVNVGRQLQDMLVSRVQDELGRAA